METTKYKSVTFAPDFVNYKKGCAIDKVYQLLAHGRWFSPVAPASSITKTGRHDIAEILLKVALNTKNKKTGKLYQLRTLFCNLQSRVRTHAVLVIGLYEFIGNPTT
jgi:hypothetical protein